MKPNTDNNLSVQNNTVSPQALPSISKPGSCLTVYIITGETRRSAPMRPTLLTIVQIFPCCVQLFRWSLRCHTQKLEHFYRRSDLEAANLFVQAWWACYFVRMCDTPMPDLHHQLQNWAELAACKDKLGILDLLQGLQRRN